MTDEELFAFAKEIQAPFHLLKETAKLKRLPGVNFAAAGSRRLVCLPYGFIFEFYVFDLVSADAALMMHLGCDGGRFLCLFLHPLRRLS
jgi:pyridoxal 5'-phosphate synthase pdxS subunit